MKKIEKDIGRTDSFVASKSVETSSRRGPERKRKRMEASFREEVKWAMENEADRPRECVVAPPPFLVRRHPRKKAVLGKGEWKEREKKTREGKRNDSVGLSRTSFIFSSRLNIKDNLIIGGFSKASRFFLPRSSFTPASFYPLYPSSLIISRKTEQRMHASACFIRVTRS